MNVSSILRFFILSSLVSFSACQPAGSSDKTVTEPASRPVSLAVATSASVRLDPYWYQGKAEISTYELQQNRYSDLHPGESVLIFVTEDFLTDIQVKNERYENPNSAKVLKTNAIHRFSTGIYDYSMMNSVFTPVAAQQFPHTFKVSSSSQDWCGQTFMQINLREQAYEAQLHSYFEKEADRVDRTPVLLLEDELFNRIRIQPEALPTGDIQLLPSAMYCRLMHVPFKAQQARATLADYQGKEFPGANLRVYRVEFPSYQRTLEIIFEGRSPYLIAGWKDSFPSLQDKQIRTTLARRKQTILEAYWTKNSLEDLPLREKLDLKSR